MLAGAAWAGAFAVAQAAEPSAAASDAKSSAESGAGDSAAAVGVEQVVVTARRRKEDSQSVPIALNAFSGQSLEARRTYNLRDVQQLAPSLDVTITNPRNTSILIRGLGNNVSVYNDGLQPAVGVYLDQVYLGRPGQAVFDLADLSSVEVLRGPQGTLFGKNTSAGAVVIATNEPKFTPEIIGDASFGSHDYYQTHLTVGGPILDGVLAGRLSLAQTQHGGYATNLYSGSRTDDYRDWSLCGQLLFTPTAEVKWRLTADYGQQRASTADSEVVGLLTNYTNGKPYPFGYLQRLASVGVTPLPIDPDDRTVDVNGLNNYWEEQGGVASILDVVLPLGTLTSVTSYRGWNWSPHNDGDGTQAPAGLDFHQSNQQQQFSQEVRLASRGRHTVDYVAGAYVFWQEIKAQALNAYGPEAANWFISPAAATPTVAAAALDNYTIVSHSGPTTLSAAAFAEGVWHATSKVDLTLGLRYTYEKMTGYFRQTADGVDISGLTATQQAQALALRARYGVANSFDASTQNGSVTGRANLTYHVTDQVLAYGVYSRGYKAGGLNLSNINTTGSFPVSPVVGPETLDSYELGLKSSWLDKRLIANLALFWTEDSNYQTTQINLVSGVSSLSNAGKARSRGVEADLQAQPISDLSVYASATYDDATYESYKNAPCAIEVQAPTCDLTGRQLPGPPRWSASTGGEYKRGIGEIRGFAAEAYLGGDYSYRSSVYTTAADSLYSLIPGYGLLNLRAGVRARDGAWDIQVWARNAADADYFLSRAAGNTGAVTGVLGDPRTYGVTLRARY
jgi:iron complex outermembrane receptor protein